MWLFQMFPEPMRVRVTHYDTFLSQILQNSLNLKIRVFQGVSTDKFLASKYFAVT